MLKQSPLRSLTNRDWERFEVYAPLVLHFEGTESMLLGSYSALLEGSTSLRERPRPERALLPNLTHLEITPVCQEDFRALLFLLSNRLISLKVTFSNITESDNQGIIFPQSSDYVRLAEEIISASPNLTDLDIFCNCLIDDPLVPHNLGEAIFPFLLESQSALRHLGMMLDAFQHLLHNPPPPMLQLTELDLRGSGFHGVSRPPRLLLLPALRKLFGNLPQNSKHIWIPLISDVGSTIEEISFNANYMAEEYADLDLVELVDVITVTGTSCPSLKSLRIYGNLTGDVAFSPGFLRPILNCTKITDLCIEAFGADFGFSLYISDDDVKSMALAWPNLEVLHLGKGSTPWTPTSITKSTPTLSPAALQALCFQCLLLRSLSLTVNLTVVPATPIRPSIMNAIPIDSFDFSGSTVKGPSGVAKWISDACIASRIRASQSHDGEDTLWVQIRNIVALLQEVRIAVETKYTDEIQRLRQEIESIRAGKQW
jgi:hypothetical protein